ncbi:Protein Y65B4A.2 [Aphelenchoides avenae]|nr:Protein Y65B4A.2 [Aphelenchus avenae]
METWWTGRRLSAKEGLLTYDPHSWEDRLFHERIVNDVNANPKATWKAAYNKFASRAAPTPSASQDVMKKAMADSIRSQDYKPSQILADTEERIKYLVSANITLPAKFDARLQWPLCASVHRIVNQAGCGSCWAMAATSVMSDRICIASDGHHQPQISAQDLISCCPHCGGCRGTVWALYSFVHWKEHGLVTGDSYGSFEGCKPYQKKPDCGFPCSTKTYNSPNQDTCEHKCQSLYAKQYNDDLQRAQTVYWVKPNDLNSVFYPERMTALSKLIDKVGAETLLKREIVLSGPILGCFSVYEEFQHYTSGIYQSRTSANSSELYGHCAKIIGWGEEKGIRYWIWANTWGRSWGEHGFFRVTMDELPEDGAAGIPIV